MRCVDRECRLSGDTNCNERATDFMRRITGLSLASLLLVSCQPVQRPDSARAGAQPVQAAVVHGRAIYLERIALPPGATLDVLLLAMLPEGIETATVARQTFSDLHGPPFEFSLPYDPARVPKDAQLQLRANLRDAQGHLEFLTAARVPVPADGSIAGEIRLVRATTP
jgi:uncharacterized lipoprotein YbaY